MGVQLLKLAYQYHFQNFLLTKQARGMSVFNMEKKDLVYPYKVPHGRDLDTAIDDKYARYQLVSKITETYSGVGFIVTNNGKAE